MEIPHTTRNKLSNPPLTHLTKKQRQNLRYMVAIALWQNAWTVPVNGIALSAAAGLATVSTALPIVCLYAGLKRLEVVPAAILSTLEPVVAIALSVLFLAEPLWIGQIMGGVLILASAVMLQIRTS